MKLVFSGRSWDDDQYWQAHDAKIAERLNDLIRAAYRSPFEGLGKPEPLRGQLTGWWSRRLTAEHRLIYRMSGSGPARQIEVLACRFHYGR